MRQYIVCADLNVAIYNNRRADPAIRRVRFTCRKNYRIYDTKEDKEKTTQITNALKNIKETHCFADISRKTSSNINTVAKYLKMK